MLLLVKSVFYPPPKKKKKLSLRFHCRVFIALFAVLCLLFSTAATSKTVHADSFIQWMLIPDFFAVTKLGDDKEIINGEELHYLLDGAEFQVIGENGQPLRFVKRPLTLSEFLKNNTDLFNPTIPEQKYQFSNSSSPLNYYQQALPSEPFYQKGWIPDVIYDNSLDACFDGATPSDENFTNTLVATKEEPLIIGVFPTQASAIHYIIVDGELHFFIKLEETFALKETKAPAGYELSTETPSIQADAYVGGLIVNNSGEDVEQEFLNECKKLYKNTEPVKLQLGTEGWENFSYKVNEIAESTNFTPRILSTQITDPIKTVDIPVEKKWEGIGEAHDPVNIVLLKNGTITDKTLELNKDNAWKAIFTDLRVRDKEGTEDNVYTIKEHGEENGKLILNGDEYQVAISGDMSAGFTVTNTHIAEEQPTPPTPPTIPDNPVGPTIPNQPAASTMVTELPKTGDDGMPYVYGKTMLGVAALLIGFRRKLKHTA